MQTQQYVHRTINLLLPERNTVFNMTLAEAEALVATGDSAQVSLIDGQFAFCVQVGRHVRMARSIGRPLRYFLAKKSEGPCLIVAERMEEIREQLDKEGLVDQFHPSYTRMVPAHFVVEIELIGCPDPNPRYERFFEPKRNVLPADPVLIGERYIQQLLDVCDRWLDRIPRIAPIGVLFSGGIDSGAVFLALYHQLLARGESPSRLKAFTLQVGGASADADQAIAFMKATKLDPFLEIIDQPSERIQWREAVKAIEDYKPLDVQCAAMGLALCQGIRERYPDWKYLADGDGGDENLKDYPIEENPELTIRSVLNNTMLYQEGWGVHAIKHSLVYSGGQSRGHVRTWAPASRYGFEGFSPFATPKMIEVAEGIPFIELTQWDHQKLYELKGQIIRHGVRNKIGIEMPIFEKRRFQRGAVASETFASLFPANEAEYRRHFLTVWNA